MDDERRRRLRQMLRRVQRPALFGTLRRTEPLSDDWGEDRGRPIDRYYIEKFIAQHRSDIRGRVLEVKNREYTLRYGTSVQSSDVVDIAAANREATIIADLQDPAAIESGSFDCFILTQTLQLLYDLHSTIHHAHRMLRPGGVLLVTVPAVSRTTFPDRQAPDLWRFTETACTRLFSAVFGEQNVQVTAYGNVLPCIAFLLGLAEEELKPAELDACDERFPLVVAVRAVR